MSGKNGVLLPFIKQLTEAKLQNGAILPSTQIETSIYHKFMVDLKVDKST